MTDDSTKINRWRYEPVPHSAIPLFHMCWQLENWLRTIVYVELKANQIDWEKPIESKVQNWPPASIAQDKKLHHMATPHQNAISYLTFGQLWDVIREPKNWELFAPYFPPKDNTEVRIAEVKAIRNRIAHFREPDQNDLARLTLFMKDMETGVRKFCLRYTLSSGYLESKDDSVATELERVWERIGWRTELHGPHGWLYAPEPHRRDPQMHAKLEIHYHPRHKAGIKSPNGMFYRITVGPNISSKQSFDVSSIFAATHRHHNDIIHFLLMSLGTEVAITIPAILGSDRITEIVAAVIPVARDSMTWKPDTHLDRAKLSWPEYVLWPDHMLTIFGGDVDDPILELPGML